jgi:hypothetical protein
VGHDGRWLQLPLFVELGIDIVAATIFYDRVAVDCRVVVQILIAVQADGDCRTVGLRYSNGLAIGRHCIYPAGAQDNH